jgi:hypothetical protein
MDAAPSVDLLRVAAACVKLVDTRFGRQLDWSVDSLRHLDDVCAELSADEPLEGQRFDLWWRLIAGYTGQVVVEAYGGQWDSEKVPRPTVRVFTDQQAAVG